MGLCGRGLEADCPLWPSSPLALVGVPWQHDPWPQERPDARCQTAQTPDDGDERVLAMCLCLGLHYTRAHGREAHEKLCRDQTLKSAPPPQQV